MKFLDEYRDPTVARRLVTEIRQLATRRWTVMEVCGGQTHSLLRHGIDVELEDLVELIHGPGCPVCVTSIEAIDFAQRLCQTDGVLLTTFGDMIRVPGSCGSLLEMRAVVGNVRPVYSPLDAVAIAQRDPDRQVIFFAVGFETTAPATALAVRRAAQLGLDNFSLLVSHVRVLPAMEMIAASADCRVQAFLAAGHVCTVTGAVDYAALVERYRLPIVVTGFEPVDLLQGICECVRQLERGESRVVNCYARTARDGGNPAAQRLIDDVYESCDQTWRGFGSIPGGGLRLRREWQRFDAALRFRACHAQVSLPIIASADCRSADVLAGRIRPTACPSFGTRCTPDNALGAPMVSSEGACAAYFRYSAASTNGATFREGNNA